MYHISYQEASLQEYKDSLIWYGVRSQEVAVRFKNAIEEKISELIKNPQGYKNVYKNYYEIHLKKFPFTIVYIIEEAKKNIVIISIYHQKRNPLKKYRK